MYYQIFLHQKIFNHEKRNLIFTHKVMAFENSSY